MKLSDYSLEEIQKELTIRNKFIECGKSMKYTLPTEAVAYEDGGEFFYDVLVQTCDENHRYILNSDRLLKDDQIKYTILNAFEEHSGRSWEEVVHIQHQLIIPKKLLKVKKFTGRLNTSRRIDQPGEGH